MRMRVDEGCPSGKCLAFIPYSGMTRAPHACCTCGRDPSDTAAVVLVKGYSGDGRELLPSMDGWRTLAPCPDCSSSARGEEPPTVNDDVLRRMRIDALYEDASFKTFQTTPDAHALDAAKRFVVNFGQKGNKHFLLLASRQKGNGKTHLAIACLRALYEQFGEVGQFWPVTSLLRRYRATMDEDHRETLSAIEKQLMALPMLVLDDLGAEKETDWTRDTLYELINARYSKRLHTIVTTNVPLEEYDERIARRVADEKNSSIVYFRGGDKGDLSGEEN